MIQYKYSSAERVYKLYQLSSRQVKTYNNSEKKPNNVNRLTK